MKSEYGLEAKHKMRTRLEILGSNMYYNFQAVLDLQTKQKKSRARPYHGC